MNWLSFQDAVNFILKAHPFLPKVFLIELGYMLLVNLDPMNFPVHVMVLVRQITEVRITFLEGMNAVSKLWEIFSQLVGYVAHG